MAPVLALLVIAAAAIVVIVAIRRGLATRPDPQRPRSWPDDTFDGDTVVLDVDSADPQDPAVQRLVREAGQHALRAAPGIDRVRVVGRDGRPLGSVERPKPLPELDVPPQLHEPHAGAHRAPSAVRGERPRPPGHLGEVDVGDDASPRRRAFADRLELPPAVEAQLRSRDDPVEAVRAILAAAGHDVDVDRDLIKVGDLAIVIAADVLDRPTEALNHAFMRCQEARVPQGLVIRLGWVNAEELRHREALAPWVRHVDGDAIQRMADAVAVGADPVHFAAGPRLTRS